MLSLLIPVILTFFATRIDGAPYNPYTLHRRGDAPDKSAITTTIHSANGTDVTSSFQTRVYWQPDTKVAGNSSLNDRQVSTVRKIKNCRSHTARFVQSHCAHSKGFEVSLLEYTVYCQEFPSPRYNFAMGYAPNGDLLEPIMTTEEGACQAHEICVNEIPRGHPSVMFATCVDINDFLHDPNPSQSIRQSSQHSHATGDADDSQHGAQDLVGASDDDTAIEEALRRVDQALGNRRASVIISGPNGTMPMGVENLEVDTGAGSGGKIDQQTCTNCFGLRTQKAPADTDFMNTKATLMTATALTGFVWITIFSG